MRTTHYSTYPLLLWYGAHFRRTQDEHRNEYHEYFLPLYQDDTPAMTRMHAPHTTCPGCREEVYLEELVRGCCPLCGCTLGDFDEQEGEIEELIERSDLPWLVFTYFLFKRFLEIGASPIQIMQLVAAYNDQDLQGTGLKPDTRFVLEVPMTLIDALRPKRCATCGRLFVLRGRKMVTGDLATPGVRYRYYCDGC